jgi:phage baseplate assembly protein V
MIRRGKIDIVNDENPVQTAQLKVFRDEIRQGVERPQQYGFTSVPLPGCQAVVVAVDGECGHELIVSAEDRRYRPRGLKPGDVMLYTNKNPDAPHHIYFRAADRTLVIRANKIELQADNGIDIDAGTGDLRAKGANFRWKGW